MGFYEPGIVLPDVEKIYYLLYMSFLFLLAEWPTAKDIWEQTGGGKHFIFMKNPKVSNENLSQRTGFNTKAVLWL